MPPAGTVGAQISANVDEKATSDDVYKILVEGIPFPDSTVSWPDVLAFRSEPASQLHLLALRKWVRDTAQENLTVKDAIDEINRLKGEYRLHIKGADIKAAMGVVEAIVVGGLGFGLGVGAAGAIPTAVRNAFKVLKIRCELREAERKAEGRELAYIVKAEERLRLSP